MYEMRETERESKVDFCVRPSENIKRTNYDPNFAYEKAGNLSR
jgi:hypothetical protein